MLWHIFGCLMSHSLLVPIGMMVDHDSPRGDQAVGFYCDRDIFIMLGSGLFSVVGPLRVGVIVCLK